MISSRAVVLVAVLICAGGSVVLASNRQAQKPLETRVNISENQYLPKGGVGMIKKDLYINLKSANNELMLGSTTWAGRSSRQREVVFVSAAGAISPDPLPADFHLQESVLVSFENEKVLFFDFKSGKGGFYPRRLVDNAPPSQ
jgi:hypothetical protein